MGHKVHPVGFRIGVIRGWESRWFSKLDFSKNLVEDVEIRKFVKMKLQRAGVPRVEIERAANRVKVTVHAAKPGMVIGKGGSGADELKIALEKMTGKVINLNIQEIRSPDLSAQLVADKVAEDLAKRMAFRRTIKQAVQRSLKAGAKGVKVMVAGRLGGAEIARSEWYREGTIPLQTLRADIDYSTQEAHTTYGRIGVKVWIYKGEVLPDSKKEATPPRAVQPQGGK